MKRELGKRVPHFWWDLHWHKGRISDCIVESDDDRHPIAARFSPEESDCAMKMCEDLKAGRLDYRRLAAKFELNRPESLSEYARPRP